MIKEYLKYGILPLLAIGVSGFNSFGQDTCDLQIGVYEFKQDGSSEQFPVPDAKIKLVSAKTGKTLSADNATFAVISGEQYKITAAKDGFQRTAKLFTVDCNQSDDVNRVSEIVFLWKGNIGQTFEFRAQSVGGAENYEASAGVPLNSGAIFLGKPSYPAAARATRTRGRVEVQVTINELGNVIFAKAAGGHPLLQAASVKAARESKFRMTFLEGIPVKVTGIIVYNFVP